MLSGEGSAISLEHDLKVFISVEKKQPQCEKPKPAGKIVFLILLGGDGVSERNYCITGQFASNLLGYFGAMVILGENYRAL